MQFRFVKPVMSDWFKVRGRSAIGEMQDVHLEYANEYSVTIRNPYEEDGKKSAWDLALVEFDDGSEQISRIVTHGIYRAGGVKPTGRWYTAPLKYAAEKLGVSVEDINFPDEDWLEQETIEEAFERRHKEMYNE